MVSRSFALSGLRGGVSRVTVVVVESRRGVLRTGVRIKARCELIVLRVVIDVVLSSLLVQCEYALEHRLTLSQSAQPCLHLAGRFSQA